MERPQDEALASAVAATTMGRAKLGWDSRVGRRLLAATRLPSSEAGALRDRALLLGSDAGENLLAAPLDIASLDLKSCSAAALAELDMAACLVRHLLEQTKSGASSDDSLQLMRGLQRLTGCGLDAAPSAALQTVHRCLRQSEHSIDLSQLTTCWSFIAANWRRMSGPLQAHISDSLVSQSFAGLFLLSALAEHSCSPNCTWSVRPSPHYNTPEFWLQPLREISPGEALTTTYVSTDVLALPFPARARNLAMHPWYLQPCCCTRCDREMSTHSGSPSSEVDSCVFQELFGCLWPQLESLAMASVTSEALPSTRLLQDLDTLACDTVSLLGGHDEASVALLQIRASLVGDADADAAANAAAATRRCHGAAASRPWEALVSGGANACLAALGLPATSAEADANASLRAAAIKGLLHGKVAHGCYCTDGASLFFRLEAGRGSAPVRGIVERSGRSDHVGEAFSTVGATAPAAVANGRPKSKFAQQRAAMRNQAV